MSTRQINLSTFQASHSFYKELTLLVTIKSFDLKAIRERYLKNKNKPSNRTGSVNRRKTAIGGVAYIKISKGKIQAVDILTQLPEPRGIDSKQNLTAFSSENKVHVIDLPNHRLKTITNPWFSYIHTVDINPDTMDHLLVSSSGFDSIFEYAIGDEKQTYEWFAWENGFDRAVDPETGKNFYLTRNPNKANQLEQEGKSYLLINDPTRQILPTAKRAAFINSVVYDPLDKDSIIATFFHEGAVYQISRSHGHAKRILTGLVNPHGGYKLTEDEIMGTSTKEGKVIKTKGSRQYHYDFSAIPGKPEFLSDFEWIQNSIYTGEGNILSIDSNRNCFVIFNPESGNIDFIPYDENWAVQDIVESSVNPQELKKLAGRFSGE
jgi:hypothetical protein